MTASRYLHRLLLGLLCPILWAGSCRGVTAQTVEVLLTFTNVWQYDDTGRELGTDWRSPSYVVDANWRSGPGLLGYEDNIPNPYRSHAPVNTVLFINPFVTNYYFRTTFTFHGSSEAMSLVASNLIDDGAVIYLNGVEVGRSRMPLNQNAATYASGTIAEGTLEPSTITNLSLLREGENLLAAELHQGSFASVDAVWGMKLVAIRPQPLVLLSNLPPRVIAFISDSLTFQIGLSGTPADYQWFKNGDLVGTNATLRLSQLTSANAGNYFVVVSNSISVVTSAVTRLLIFPDSNGPEAIEAVGKTNSANSSFRGAPTIDIGFNEPLLVNAQTTNAENFIVYAGTNFLNSVPFTNVTSSFTDKPRIHLWMTGTNWVIGADYYVLILGGVTDSRGTNRIDPNTLVPVSWPMLTNLLSLTAPWHFYASAFLDPTFPAVYREFFLPDYDVNQHGGWGGPAPGVLYITQGDPGLMTCVAGALQSQINFQMLPTLFRREFFLPPGWPLTVVLTNRFIVDDGLVLYLNGTELYRWNVPGTQPIDWNTEASSTVLVASCLSVSLTTQLRPGTNVIAAAVVQSSYSEGDTVFGLDIDALLYRTSPLPAPSGAVPRLHSYVDAANSNLVLSWPSNLYGAKLETTTNLADPLWFQVKDQSLPYTDAITSRSNTPARYYRLNMR